MVSGNPPIMWGFLGRINIGICYLINQWDVWKILDKEKNILKTHMCGGKTFLVPYLSLKEDGRALALSPLTLSFSR
jgi:hypothetical protein